MPASKRWRDLSLRVWHRRPAALPRLPKPMRVIAMVDNPRIVEKILRHLGVWHDPPPSRRLCPARSAVISVPRNGATQ
jgi:hypothetical protein